MTLRRRKQQLPYARRSLVDDSNYLFVGPGGQIVAVDDPDPNTVAVAASQLSPPAGETSQVFTFDVQPTPAVSLSTPATVPSSLISTSSASAASGSSASTPPSTTSLSSTPSPSSSFISSTSYSSSGSSLLPSDSSLPNSDSISSSSLPSASSSVASTSYTPAIAISTTSSASFSSASSSMPSSTSVWSTPTSTAINAAAVSSKHPATFYFCVIFGAIVGFACLVAFIAWCYRICSRRDKDPDESDPWPWDRDNRDHHLESGFGDSHVLDGGRWSAHDTLEEKPATEDTGYTRRDPFGIRYPTGAIHKDVAVPRTPKTPMLGVPRHPALQPSPNSLRTPFVPVLNPHQSVPDLAPDIGRLQVTNHMPGDVSSGDEGSRANSRLGVEAPRTGSTPIQGFNRDNRAMMNVPLTPMQPKQSPVSGVQTVLEPVLPFPGQTRRKLSRAASSQRSEGWAASLRSNLANAFHAVVGSQSSPSGAEGLLSGGQESSSSYDFHPNREKGEASPGKQAYDGLEVPVVSLDPIDDSGHGDWDDLSAWMTDKRFTPRPPSSAVLRPLDRLRTPVFARAIPSPNPPSLHPPLCRKSTSESMEDAETQRRNLQELRRSQKCTKRSKKLCPTLQGRTSSLSVGSDMSRASSTSSGPLTEQEKFAKTALRERRRRVLRMRDDQGGRCMKVGSFNSRLREASSTPHRVSPSVPFN